MNQLLYLVLFSSAIPSIAQVDPDLIGTWDLSRIEIKFSTGLEIATIDPPMSPWLTIEENLEFNGYGSCNSFTGLFEAPSSNMLETLGYNETTATCDDNFHNLVEEEYFNYFELGNTLEYFFTEIDGVTHLIMGEGIPGFYLDFTRSVLSNETPDFITFKLYPNPASNSISIFSENFTAEEIAIHDFLGRRVPVEIDSDHTINVSALPNGIYFLEVTSENRTIVKKFVKN